MKSLYLKTEEAVGKVLCHDITQIVKDTFKGVAFKKGHLIRAEDVEELLRLGKSHIALIELDPQELHEEEAGLRLAQAIRGPGIVLKGPSEGRYDLIAETRGLLKIRTKPLLKINRIPRVVVATLHTMTPVLQGEKVAGTKIVPLAIEEGVIRKVEAICADDGPVVSVLPYRKMKVGAVITGREVYEGRIEDGFGPVLKEKCAFWGLESPALLYCVDDAAKISAAIDQHLGQGCELILATGGMSVDADDVTPLGIRKTGARIIKYGAPVMPGAMFLLAYKGDCAIIGAPGCVMYSSTTILDLLLPRVLTGERLTADEICRLGHGGLCRSCKECVYPRCAFGKGVAS
ncbi:MAG: molybdopterin-binding protein [Syntrophus sp. RIFOXYC2_FULL_54_9]|nr:MAG: molybdopterin-binding protein [Syntrophus sp. RIFOXYC2_FULL_54_9]